ncbi:hypothetical protein [Candidatus Poriferisodalis sp.]|uniref:hypothetical protein n=1 Tax=Candidatus Poriferisodalis sp. TaxID=3101277 RepID=UPI003B02DC84
MTSQNRPAVPALIVERFDGGSGRAQRIFAAALLIMGVGLGTIAVSVPDDDLSGAGRLWVSILLVAGFVAVSWMFGRMRLELQIDDRGFTARVRPFRRVRVDAQAVVHAELVEVQPVSEFDGWWDKGRRGNRLLGGTGQTALRVTYLEQTAAREPKTCRLTLLSTHAERLFALVGSGAEQSERTQPAQPRSTPG